MGTYRIAGLHVYMEPQFTQILTTSEKFKTDGSFPAQITIPYKRWDYERWLRERPHLTLSDAENICTCNFFACGTPWCGNSQECENITAPLGAIIFLNRGKENHIERLFKTAQILPLLLMQTVHRTSAGKLDMVLAFADQLIQSVPVYKLDCTMDVEAVKIVSETII